MIPEHKRIELDLVDAIEFYDDSIEDETGSYRWYEVISWRGWNDKDFGEHQVKFEKQANELLKLLGCNLDSGEVAEGPNSCSVSAWKDLE